MSHVTEPLEIPKGDPKVEELEALPRGESQWGIILREFKKRKAAVVCYLLLVLVAAVSIFAPFLANDRPIAYVGYNRGEYERAQRTVRVLIGQVLTPPPIAKDDDPDDDEEPPTAEELAEQRRASVIDRLAAMRDQVAGEDAAKIDEFTDRFTAAEAARDEAALRELRTELRDLSGDDVAFSTRWRSPVVAALGALDLLFMTAAALFLISPLWRMLLRRRFAPGHPAINRITLAVLVAVPLLAAGLWKLTVPEFNDLSRYKRGVLAGADEGLVARSPVVYDAVLWPPIPFALDEDDLNELSAAPPWWPKQKPKKNASEPEEYPNGLPADPPHLLGTDSLGRDLACRMIWGGRVSLAVGVVAVAIYVAIGIIVGSIAGYFRGWVDMIISRIIEVVICFPSFFLILAIVAFIGPGMFNIMVVIGLTSWTGVARLVRAEFLRLGEQEFVLAGRALGYSAPRIIFRHVLPNSMAPVLVSATFGVAGAILTESALSFLGLGITVPTPSWGSILSDGRAKIFDAPWIIYFPGFAIFLTITCYNLVGEAFRDAADPRLRGSR